MGTYFNNEALDVLWSKLVCATQAICSGSAWDGSYNYTVEDESGNKWTEWTCGVCGTATNNYTEECGNCGNYASFLREELSSTGIKGVHDALLTHFGLAHDNTPTTPGDYMKGIAVAARYYSNGNIIDTESENSLEEIVAMLKEPAVVTVKCSYCDSAFDSGEDYITRDSNDGYTYYYHYNCAREVETIDPMCDCTSCGTTLNVYEEYMYNDLCESCYSNSECDHDYIWEPYGDNQHVYRCTNCGDELETGYCYNDTGGYCICGRNVSDPDPEPDTYTYYNAQYHKTSSGALEAHYDYAAPDCICGAAPCPNHGGYYTEDNPCPDCDTSCKHENANLDYVENMGDYHELHYYCVDCDYGFVVEKNHSYDPDTGDCVCGATRPTDGYKCCCAYCDGEQCNNYVSTEYDTCNWCLENCQGGGSGEGGGDDGGGDITEYTCPTCNSPHSTAADAYACCACEACNRNPCECSGDECPSCGFNTVVDEYPSLRCTHCGWSSTYGA